VKKLAYVFNAQHVALPHSFPFYVHDAGTILRFLPIGPWLLVPLGLAGLVFAAPAVQRTEYLIWVSFVPLYAAAVAVFFVAERYRLPLLIPLSVGAGAAIDTAMSLVVRRQFRNLTVPIVVFMGLFVLANWRSGLNDGRWEEGLRLAQRLVILGRFDEADQWARRIAPREPRPGATDYGLGAQLLLANQTGRALEHLERAQQADPSGPNVGYALGQALLAAGRAQEAVPHLRRGFEAGIELPKGGYDLAVALQATGDLRGSADVIRRIRPSEHDDVEAWLRLGRLATQVRAPDLAEPFFRQAVQMRPNQASARQQHGLNLLVLGRYHEAARELSEAARLDPQDPDTLSHLAYTELRLGRLADAREHTERALAINPDDPMAKQLMTEFRRIR
jgi:tetratricopeptide (TPR) repeat protein